MTKFYSDSNTDQHAHLSASSSDWQRIGEVANKSGSILIGKVIGQVDVYLARASSSTSGTIYCRIRKGSNDSIAAEIGHLDVSTIAQLGDLPTTPKTFGPNNSNTYVMQLGDKVSIEYSSGSSSNYIRIGCDGGDGVDSSNSCRFNYDGSYSTITSDDLSGNFWTAIAAAAPPPPAGPPPPPSAPGLIYSQLVANTTGAMSSYILYDQRIGQKCVDSSSILFGQIILQADVYLALVGFPSGTLSLTIRDSSDTLRATLGTINVSTLTTSGLLYSFTGGSNTFAMTAGSRIQAEFTGGDQANYVKIWFSSSDTIDSSHSIFTYHRSTGYFDFSGNDLSGKLWTASSAPPPPPAVGGYTSNTLKDLAGNMWSIATGSVPPPPPPPPGTPPPPPPTVFSKIYDVINHGDHNGVFMNRSGKAGDSIAYTRVGEIINSTTSQLVGKILKEVDFDITKIGSPQGFLIVTIREGIYDIPIAFMGFLITSSITQDYKTYRFINHNNFYKLKKGDKILLEYSSGDSNNYIGIDENNSDPFDGANTTSVYYTISRVYGTKVGQDVVASFWV